MDTPETDENRYLSRADDNTQEGRSGRPCGRLKVDGSWRYAAAIMARYQATVCASPSSNDTIGV